MSILSRQREFSGWVFPPQCCARTYLGAKVVFDRNKAGADLFEAPAELVGRDA